MGVGKVRTFGLRYGVRLLCGDGEHFLGRRGQDRAVCLFPGVPTLLGSLNYLVHFKYQQPPRNQNKPKNKKQ